MSGSVDCGCRDCFEIAIGEPGCFCDECLEVGCRPDRECDAPGAYGAGYDGDEYWAQAAETEALEAERVS